MNDLAELEPGALIGGRYRVEAVIGRGGMGVVYRASELPLGLKVAVKVLRVDLAQDPRARARFEREARVASALDHPAAVRVHGFGEDAGATYLVMELFRGRTLAEHIAGAAMPLALAIELSTQLADAMHSAHRIGLVHRDLKPENVFLSETRPDATRLRVLDFGLAFLGGTGPTGRLTREGVVVGTPAYLSPEQARGEAVGPPTDIYAMGCILHELLTGHPPFIGADMHVLTAQMFAPPPPIFSPERPLPAALDSLRRAMLNKRSALRPGADEVRDRLAALEPDPDRGRVRASQDSYLGARARRMVDAPGPSAAEVDAGDPGTTEIGIVGAASPQLLMGLAANGFVAFVVGERETVGPRTRALYAPGATGPEIRALAHGALPVLSDAARGDVSRLSELLRAGAADVVIQPVDGAQLARKLTRIIEFDPDRS